MIGVRIRLRLLEGRGRAVLLGTIVALSGAALAVPHASQASAPRALINADTVGAGTSVEQNLAVAAGFAVTVVSGATWDAMTAASFATYQVLIAGDRSCSSSLAPSFTSNAGTWAPVVMGTSVTTQPGNRVLIGTDPVFHRGAHPGADHLIQDGIAFAGALAGRTGVYLDDTCARGGASTLATLNRLSVGSGSWTANASPPCGGSVSLVASNPLFASLKSTDLAGWSCSVHETFPTFPDDWNALVVATDTPSKPVCGSDPSGAVGNKACGQPYVLISGIGTVVLSPNLALTPASASDTAGGTATVTANILNGATPPAPVVGQTVNFTVSGQNGGTSGTCSPASCATDASGTVTFSYGDLKGVGDDTITATFTDSGGSKQQATAVVHWVKPVDAAITVTGAAASPVEGTVFTGPVATFTDPDTSATAAEYGATITWGDGSTSAATILGSGGSFTAYGTHTYAEEGTDTVSVSITDTSDAGNSGTAISTATVADAPLSTSSSTISAPEGTTVVGGTLVSFSDGDSNGTAGDYTATIDWGDGGGSAPGTVASDGNGGFTVSGAHAYAGAEEGIHAVTVSISDAGGATATVSSSVHVTDTALSATATKITATAGSPVSGTVASFVDGDPDATASDFTATVSWGDGSSSAAGAVASDGKGGFTVAGTHTYAEKGTYSISVSIGDAGGASTSVTSGAFTRPPPPVAQAATGSTVVGTPVSVTPGSPAGAGGPFTFALVGTPAPSGTATIDASTGTVTYTPAAGWSGIATLTYIATDQYSQKSGPATVTITVAPVAVAVAASSTGQKTVTVQAAPHGTGPFTYSLIASTLPPAADGVVTVDPHTGLVSFAPASGFLGQFTVRYTVSDGAGVTSPPSTITFAVKGVAVTQQSVGSGTPDAGSHLASTGRTAALLAVPGVLILLGCALPLLRRRRPGTVG